MTRSQFFRSQEICEDIPLPIVKLNRWVLFLGIIGALVFQQPIVTTVLFALLLPASLMGQRASLIHYVGRWLFITQIAIAEREDHRLQRFNNAIATTLLGAAQLAFLLGYSALGWALALAVATAALIALLGFCVGCFVYYQFRLNHYRLFGR